MVAYKGRFYIGSISAIVSIYLLFNLYQFFVNGNLFAFIAIVIQSALLVLAYIKHDWFYYLLIAWTVLMIAGAGLALFSAALRIIQYYFLDMPHVLDDFDIWSVVYNCTQLGIALIYLLLIDDYILDAPKANEQSTDLDAK